MRRQLRGATAVALALIAFAAVVVAAATWWASRRAPLPPSLDGPCRVRAVIDPSNVLIDPGRSGGVYPVPLEGTVRYEASTGGTADPGPRRLQGSLRLDLPPLLPDVTLAAWDEVGALPDNQGTRAYRLAERWAPVGLTVRVWAEHREPGVRCAGALTFRIDGSAFGSLLRPLVVGLLVLGAWLTARAGRPRPARTAARHDPWSHPDPWSGADPWADTTALPVTERRPPSSTVRAQSPARHPGAGAAATGALAGLLYGVALGSLLLLAGAVELGSAWVLLTPLVGLASGAAWAVAGPRLLPPGGPHDGGEDVHGPGLALIEPH